MMTDGDEILADNCRYCGVLRRFKTMSSAREFARFGCRSCRHPLVPTSALPPAPALSEPREPPRLYERLMRDRLGDADGNVDVK